MVSGKQWRTIYQSRPEQTTRPTLPDPRKNFDLQRLNVNEGPADVEELLHPGCQRIYIYIHTHTSIQIMPYITAER